MTKGFPCPTCGVLQGFNDIDERMWEIYDRISDGRSRHDPLVFDSEWLSEHVQDEDDYADIMHAMEKNMHERGLCPTCSRPNLAGVTEDQIMSEEDMQSMHDMWNEQDQERRMGC